MKLFLFMISLKNCLTISLVSSTQTLMSWTRISFLSGDLPLSLLIAFCNTSVVILDILLSSLISCSKSSLIVLVKSFVEFPEDVDNSFSRCDAFSSIALYFCDECFLLCYFDHFERLWTLAVSSFFFSDAFSMRLIRSFSRCYCSFGCASPLLESQDFSIFVQEFFVLFSCCR